MKIRQSTINELIKVIMDRGFNPNDFIMPDLSNTVFNNINYKTGSTGTEYKFIYKNNHSYYFIFVNHSVHGIYCPKICPAIGEDNLSYIGSPTLNKLKEILSDWLVALKLKLTLINIIIPYMQRR
jgi:hypothetical protein